MPIRPEWRSFYGHQWQTVDRPAALARAHYECERCATPDRPMGLKSALEGAHLDGNPANREDDNVACLCHRCHRAHDYVSWSLAYRAYLARRREERIDANDAARPILQMLKSGKFVEQCALPGGMLPGPGAIAHTVAGAALGDGESVRSCEEC